MKGKMAQAGKQGKGQPTMGMAASQARLLSITSRLGDNELRAQIVNNNKMRLAAASSKASAAYVQALNDATMMISNYDAQGNSMYTPLTFNSLTRYSQYNNQYGLTDVNGNLLVSESEANMFRNAHGVLDEYLAAHGFEKATTYFDSTALFDFVQGSENQEIWIDEAHTTSLPLEQLKTMYLGGEYDGKEYDSYDVAISNGKYGQYKEQQIAFAESIKKLEQKAKIQSAVNGVLSNNSTTPRNEVANTTQKLFDNATEEDLNSDIQALRNVLGSSQFNSNTVLKTTKNEDGTITNYTVANLRNDLYNLKPSANSKNGTENAHKVTHCNIYDAHNNARVSDIYLNRTGINTSSFKVLTENDDNSNVTVGDSTIVSYIININNNSINIGDANNNNEQIDASTSYNKDILVCEKNNRYYLLIEAANNIVYAPGAGNDDNGTYGIDHGNYMSPAEGEFCRIKDENGNYKIYQLTDYYINKSNTNNGTTYNYDTILLLSTDSVETLSGDGIVDSNPSTTAGEATTINTWFNKGGYFYTLNGEKGYCNNDRIIEDNGTSYLIETDENGNETSRTAVNIIAQLSDNYDATNIPEGDFKKIREYLGSTRILYELASNFATQRETFDGNIENITPYFAPVNTGWARASIATNNNANSVRCVTYARNVDANGNVTYSPNYFYGENQGYNDYQYKPDTYTFGNGSSSVAIDFSTLDATKTLFYDKNGGFIAAEDNNGNLYNANNNPISLGSYANAGEYLTANNVLFSVNKYGNSLMFRTMDDRKVTNNGSYYYMPMGIGGNLVPNNNPSLYCGFPADNTNDEGLSVDYKTRYRFIDGLRYYLHIDYTNIKNGDEDQLFYGNHPVTNLNYEESGENEGRLNSFEINNSVYTLDENDGTYKNGTTVVDPASFTTKVDKNNISVSFVNDKSVKSDEEIYAEVIEKCKEYLNLVNNNVYMVDYYSNGGDSTDSANDTNAQNLAHNDYKRAANTLIQTLFGEVSPNTTLGRYIYANLGNFTNGAWLFSDDNIVTGTQDTLKSYMQGTINSDTFLQLEALDQLFEKYGAPNCTWIDKNDPNGNADNKVQWYINLFNRMCEGYKALEDGLASSNEWIEFALESGLVTMEQVDLNHSWNPTMYSNVSDITEVTDNAAVAKAEAEYNKAMKNIEAKDKRLDIELKNIDTEHNALQTEYEQIKNVISKNIERSFKIYS